MTTQDNTAIVPEHMSGKRLDQALEIVLPDSGLRERKRLWDSARVLVDGKPRPKGYRVQQGQAIEVEYLSSGPPPFAVPEGVRVVAQNSGYMAAVYKPGGVHSEPIAGKLGHSVGACLQNLWPGRYAKLVNRLDYLTSGILAVALNEDAVQEYRRLEDEGQVEKVYLAVVEGDAPEEMVLRNSLDTNDRKKVRVLAEDGTPLRYTYIYRLQKLEGGRSLVKAVIAKGARHQIRAHLADAGYPIVGDPIYGTVEGEQTMYLHHYRLSLPEFEAKVVPQWAGWEQWGVEKANL